MTNLTKKNLLKALRRAGAPRPLIDCVSLTPGTVYDALYALACHTPDNIEREWVRKNLKIRRYMSARVTWDKFLIAMSEWVQTTLEDTP